MPTLLEWLVCLSQTNVKGLKKINLNYCLLCVPRIRWRQIKISEKKYLRCLTNCRLLADFPILSHVSDKTRDTKLKQKRSNFWQQSSSSSLRYVTFDTRREVFFTYDHQTFPLRWLVWCCCCCTQCCLRRHLGKCAAMCCCFVGV